MSLNAITRMHSHMSEQLPDSTQVQSDTQRGHKTVGTPYCTFKSLDMSIRICEPAVVVPNKVVEMVSCHPLLTVLAHIPHMSRALALAHIPHMSRTLALT